MGLQIRKRKGSPYWQITGSHGGVRVRESTGTTCKKTAEKLCTQRQAAIDRGYTGRRSFADAIEAYLNKGGEERFLGKINEILGSLPLEGVTQAVIDKAAIEHFQTYTRGGEKRYKHQPSTVKRQFYDPVATVLHHAADLGWISWRRIKKPKTTLAAPIWAEPEWFRKFWAVCSPEMMALTMFLCFTGSRIHEALLLDWKHVDLSARQAFIPKMKVAGAYRTVNLPSMLVLALQDIKGDKECGQVWGMNYHDVRRYLKQGCAKSGIPYLSTHKIGSHTYATWMRRHGADARDLVDTGRWKSIQMAERYTHTKPAEAAKKSDRFEGMF